MSITSDVPALPRWKRLLFWQVVLAPTYLLLVVLLTIGAAVETARRGPYTRWYNQQLRQRALDARLPGSPETRVGDVLGSPDNIMEFWEVLDASGHPAKGAHFVRTYEYYPYPFLPFSKFQVHCTEGIVRTLEMYDD